MSNEICPKGVNNCTINCTLLPEFFQNAVHSGTIKKLPEGCREKLLRTDLIDYSGRLTETGREVVGSLDKLTADRLDPDMIDPEGYYFDIRHGVKPGTKKEWKNIINPDGYPYIDSHE